MNMEQNKDEFGPAEIDNFLNNMNIRFYLTLCIPLLLFIIVFLDFQEKGIAFASTDSAWHYLIAIISAGTWFIGAHQYNRTVKIVQKEDTLQHKLLSFRKAAMVKYIAGALGCLVAIGALYFTKEQVFLFALGILLVLFSINRPTPYKIMKDLKLDKEERKALREYRRHL